MLRPRVAVAASGGRDSTALLHCTARQAAAHGVEVLALHVHHGLLPAADAWLEQVRAQSRRWGAVFVSRRLAGAPRAGDSVEAWARRERYRALGEMAVEHGCALVLLAHHRRDQAETWLLQALRGGGPAGLSAMPRSAVRDGMVWARPWLDLPGSAIAHYAQRHRLRFAQDASNSDPRFARSRLRAEVWPALERAFPDAEVTLAHAAERAQEAAAVLAEVVAAELPGLQRGAALHVGDWLALSTARRRLTLRAWLMATLDSPVPESLVRRLSVELPGASTARWPAAGHDLRLHRGLLRALAATVSAGLNAISAAGPTPADLSQPGALALPAWGGRFLVERTSRGGAVPEQLRHLQVRSRQGADQFQLAPRGALRSLKKQYQAGAVPTWERAGPLLVDALGQLVFAPGLGLDARCEAAPGEPQLSLQWLPDSTGPRQPAD